MTELYQSIIEMPPSRISVPWYLDLTGIAKVFEHSGTDGFRVSLIIDRHIVLSSLKVMMCCGVPLVLPERSKVRRRSFTRGLSDGITQRNHLDERFLEVRRPGPIR